MIKPEYSRHRFCVAPMLDWTDKHCRFFHRLLTTKSLLYTEMVTTGAILHGSYQRFLDFDINQNPVSFQLGGSDPVELLQCAKIIEEYGYQEINLNVGCPSDRVQNGRFGACLMAEPELVAECVNKMLNAVSIPVTVKSRIGIDHLDSYQELTRFIDLVATAGCNTFIIHARKAWLSGLSPKQNREIPPLRHDVVFQIKRDFPALNIIINGGVKTLEESKELLKYVDGVMMGREAYHNPYLLTGVDRQIFSGTDPVKTRDEIIMDLLPYIKNHIMNEGRLHNVTRHILGLFHGVPGARQWRRFLSENANKTDADVGVLLEALNSMRL